VTAGVVVYTDTAHPAPAGQNVPVVLLDAPDHLFPQQRLPDDPVQAERVAREIMASEEFRQMQPQLVKAAEGLKNAWALGLEKYPAVVFDDKYVVYGTTDVAVATQHLNAWREGRP
jgi:integrating conjugative element protein (TIGR03757 family)